MSTFTPLSYTASPACKAMLDAVMHAARTTADHTQCVETHDGIIWTVWTYMTNEQGKHYLLKDSNGNPTDTIAMRDTNVKLDLSVHYLSTEVQTYARHEERTEAIHQKQYEDQAKLQAILDREDPTEEPNDE